MGEGTWHGGQGRMAGRERPVLGAQSGPRMSEDSVGPCYRLLTARWGINME